MFQLSDVCFQVRLLLLVLNRLDCKLPTEIVHTIIDALAQHQRGGVGLSKQLVSGLYLQSIDANWEDVEEPRTINTEVSVHFRCYSHDVDGLCVLCMCWFVL